MLTGFGVAALTFMMLMYALERRGRAFIAAFAVGCALASTYGFLSGAWPFGVVEAIWCLVAARRWRIARPSRVEIGLLADQPALIPAAGELRWREWGRPPEVTDLAWWVDLSRREAGRDELPVSWVALVDGELVGVVGLGEYDIEEIRDRSPWVLGMVVAPDHRGRGIGRALLLALEAWAVERSYGQVWVSTERARDFYERCGWTFTERIVKHDGEAAEILVLAL